MSYESEKTTRKKRIDRMLKASGWKIVPLSDSIDTAKLTNHAVEEWPTKNGPADYALFAKGLLLGIVEAKKLDVGAQNVLEQAKRYSKGVSPTIGEWNKYRVPFLYSSNGELIYHLDVRDNRNLSRELFSFHTPESVETSFQTNKANSFVWLKEKPIERPGLRDYQEKAIEEFESKLEEGKRLMLLAMATGTGKTYTAFQIIHRLWKAGAKKRILFLADRNVLIDQAKDRTFSPMGQALQKIQGKVLNYLIGMKLIPSLSLTGIRIMKE